MLLSPRKSGLDSLFKDVRVFKVPLLLGCFDTGARPAGLSHRLASKSQEARSGYGRSRRSRAISWPQRPRDTQALLNQRQAGDGQTSVKCTNTSSIGRKESVNRAAKQMGV